MKSTRKTIQKSPSKRITRTSNTKLKNTTVSTAIIATKTKTIPTKSSATESSTSISDSKDLLLNSFTPTEENNLLTHPFPLAMRKDPSKLTRFQRLVYAYTRRIPKGRVATYKIVANNIGFPSASRAVGNALRHNPYPPNVPCHRVIASSGEMGGFTGQTAIASSALQWKMKLLQTEGVQINNNRIGTEFIVNDLNITPFDEVELLDGALKKVLTN